MKRYIFLLALIFFMTVGSAKAEDLYACDNGCSSSLTKALQLAPSLPHGTVISVIDLKNDTAKTYKTKHYYNAGAEEWIEKVTVVTTTQKAINALALITSKKNGILAYKVELPISIAETATDLILQPQLKDDVAQYAHANLGLVERLRAYLAATLTIFGKIVDINPVIVVEFPDFSTAEFTIGPILDVSENFTFTLELKEGSLKNNEGHTIPSVVADFLGTRTFENEANLFRNQGVAEHFNIEINQTQQCKPIATVTCSTLPSGSVQCTYSVKCY
jgi:hypothetical protein